MRTLETNFETEINEYDQHLVILVDMALTSTYRYCNSDIDIIYGGNKYTSRKMSVDPSIYNINMQIDKATIVFDNSDFLFTLLLESEEVRGKTVNIRVASLNDTGQVVAQEIIFLGVIDSANFNNSEATFTVFNLLVYWNRMVPRRKTNPNCQWEFKSTANSFAVNCSYSGAETWCDKTYSRCSTLNNTINYGGFRWVSTLIDKEIYWGKLPA